METAVCAKQMPWGARNDDPFAALVAQVDDLRSALDRGSAYGMVSNYTIMQLKWRR